MRREGLEHIKSTKQALIQSERRLTILIFVFLTFNGTAFGVFFTLESLPLLIDASALLGPSFLLCAKRNGEKSAAYKDERQIIAHLAVGRDPSSEGFDR